MPEEGETAIGVKEIAVVIPILGSALAITYNVGYFWSLDIKMFTMFSLAEHLVFALEALPIALMVAVSVVFWTASFTLGRKHGRENAETAERLIEANAITRKEVEKQKRAERIMVFVLAMLSVALGIAIIWVGVYVGGVVLLAGSLYFILFQLAPVFKDPPIPQMWISISILAIAFAVGVQVQTGEYNSETITHSMKVDGVEFKGKLLRSGDKGLLFTEDQPKQIRFVKWDKVSEIVTIPTPVSTPVAKPPEAPKPDTKQPEPPTPQQQSK
jgi:hypothetical protein